MEAILDLDIMKIYNDSELKKESYITGYIMFAGYVFFRV